MDVWVQMIGGSRAFGVVYDRRRFLMKIGKILRTHKLERITMHYWPIEIKNLILIELMNLILKCVSLSTILILISCVKIL